MTRHDLQSEVIDLVAHERGLPPDKVNLSDRLLQDLGIDGDDAVDFFISVRDRFGTDLLAAPHPLSRNAPLLAPKGDPGAAAMGAKPKSRTRPIPDRAACGGGGHRIRLT